MKIGSTIKQVRIAAGLTQRVCAERAGMSTSRWADIEADRYSPSVDNVERVAQALGTNTIGLWLARHNMMGKDQ